MDLLHRGSVKDLYKCDGGELCFEFSDRYSVFDWGEMPDSIDSKGECLANIGAIFFEVLSRQDMTHHFIKQSGPRQLEVKGVDVLQPLYDKSSNKYDYSSYSHCPTNTLVPLEVIFRLGVPEGSSLLKRDSTLNVGQRFEEPLVEFSTKLESTDRPLSEEETLILAGLNQEEMQRLKTITCDLAFLLQKLLAKIDITLWDGKFEFAFIKGSDKSRNFMLVDSIGPDELRLTYRGVQLSKECLRKLYNRTDWAQNVTLAKAMAKEKGVVDWKSICINDLGSAPMSLDPIELKLISEMYKVLTQEISLLIRGKKAFDDLISLDEWVERWNSLNQEKKGKS